MTYFSPNYVKRRSSSRKAGLTPEDVLTLIQEKVRIPYIEPVMASGEIVTTVEGDIVMSQAGLLPLVELP